MVIATYNRADAVIVAVESSLAQDWEPLEVIVVDDHSTDDTVARLRELGRSDPRLRVIAREANGGAGVARNQGIVSAGQPFVALLDSDNRFLTGKLVRQMPLLLDGPSPAISFTDYLIDDGLGQEPVVIDDWSPGREDVIERLLTGCFVNTSTVVAAREVLVACGLFRPDLTCCEDHELWLRLAALGHEFRYLPEALTAYAVTGGRLSADEAQVARDSEAVIAAFFKRSDLPVRVAERRGQWRSRWALTGAERYLASGRGRDALASLGAAVRLSPRAVRPGWVRLALWGLLQWVRAAFARESELADA